MNAVVDTVVRREARDVYVTFRIYEGDPVRLTTLDVLGVDSILDVPALKRALPLQVGDPFNRALFQASADTIVGRLKNRGYPYADVLKSYDVDAAALRAVASLEGVPGRRMRVGEVVITGAGQVDTTSVRRMLSVRPGDWFRQDQLYVTQRDLYGLGMFRSVNVVLADTLPRSGGDSTVRVIVRVAAAPHPDRGGVRLARLFPGAERLDGLRFPGRRALARLERPGLEAGRGLPGGRRVPGQRVPLPAKRSDIRYRQLQRHARPAAAGVPVAAPHGEPRSVRGAALGVQGVHAAGYRCERGGHVQRPARDSPHRRLQLRGGAHDGGPGAVLQGVSRVQPGRSVVSRQPPALRRRHDLGRPRSRELGARPLRGEPDSDDAGPRVALGALRHVVRVQPR